MTFSNRIFDVLSHSTDQVLGIGDLRKIHVMDCSAGDLSITLPDVGSTHVGLWVIIVRYNSACLITGSTPASAAYHLRVLAGGTDTIISSTAGGYVECADTTHEVSSLFLTVLMDGVWGTPSFGIWGTY